jgi:hypothetical protein
VNGPAFHSIVYPSGLRFVRELKRSAISPEPLTFTVISLGGPVFTHVFSDNEDSNRLFFPKRYLDCIRCGEFGKMSFDTHCLTRTTCVLGTILNMKNELRFFRHKGPSI